MFGYRATSYFAFSHKTTITGDLRQGFYVRIAKLFFSHFNYTSSLNTLLLYDSGHTHPKFYTQSVVHSPQSVVLV